MYTANDIIPGKLLQVAGYKYRVVRIETNHFGDVVLRLHLEYGEIPMDVTIILPKEAPVVTWEDEISEILSKINQL